MPSAPQGVFGRIWAMFLECVVMSEAFYFNPVPQEENLGVAFKLEAGKEIGFDLFKVVLGTSGEIRLYQDGRAEYDLKNPTEAAAVFYEMVLESHRLLANRDNLFTAGQLAEAVAAERDGCVADIVRRIDTFSATGDVTVMMDDQYCSRIVEAIQRSNRSPTK